MCGIAGYIGRTPLAEAVIAQTLPLMKRRGPDAQQSRSFQMPEHNHFLSLLHSRLSIIDLNERATQPFVYDHYILSFNGEIYNYIEVRKILEKEGLQFKTTSDTEVLAAALAFWGEDALDKLEGMWAFAWYDTRSGDLLLSRDRFGEKPLYYYRDDKGALFFGSEVKFIKSLKGSGFALNENHLKRYLVNGYKSLYKQPENFFKDIQEVKSGHCLKINMQLEVSEHNYWPIEYSIDESITFDQAVKETRDLLIRSVELRLRCDVPLAFCMSGGVDSNALISLAKRELNYDVHGFTIVNKDERYEEEDMVNASVQELGIKHTAIHLETGGFMENMRELVRHHDAPVYTATFYVYWLLQRAMAEKGYKISISGSAADELFSGYYDHHLLYLHDIQGQPNHFTQSVANWQEHIQPIVRNPYLQSHDTFINNPQERGHIYLDAANFETFLTDPWSESFFEETYRTDSLLKNRMLNELFNEATPIILHEDDSNAMYCSIENRSPFLDRDLFEYANKIPVQHLIRNGAAKAVLREAIRGIAPDVVVDNRRKIGFNVPIDSLIRLDNPQVRADLLSDSPIFDYIRRDKIEALISENHLPNSKSKFLFYFISAKLFLEENF
ncbi:MAG: asparagine synthase (glutamine-hydrolyzing) [Zetaproteobacteria bacterium]|nr:MAG: asparagine synthase (glutamine-hydrolyzing) [Zetaproteobacteria bacterium]